MVINGVDVENARLLTESEILDCIRRAEAEADAPIARIRLTKLKDGMVVQEQEGKGVVKA